MQMFDILSFIVPIMFIVVFSIIIFSIIQGISTWHKNNNSPRLTVPAVIVASGQMSRITGMPMQAT